MILESEIHESQSALSGAASINFRDDLDLGVNTASWSDHAAPQPGVVISVASESDIEKTICGRLHKARQSSTAKRVG